MGGQMSEEGRHLLGGTTDTGTERVGQATRWDDHRHQVLSEEGRQLVGRTTNTRRKVRRAGNSLGAPKSEEGKQLVGWTTDNRRRLRRTGNSLGGPLTPGAE